MSKKIVLLNCLSDDIISGGNIYNKQLNQGLRRLGHNASAQIIDPETQWEKGLNNDIVYLLDSILLRYRLDWEILKLKRVIILLHMCPSLDNDFQSAEKDQIIENEKIAYRLFPIISAGKNNLNYISELLQINTGKAVVIPPTVSREWIKNNSLPKSPTKLLTIGSINGSKGIKRTINVLNQVKHLPWTWSHYGSVKDESLFMEIKKWAKSYGIVDRIKFYGEVSHDSINEILIDHHLLLHLSDHENNSMAIKESIAAGLPFISTPVGDHVNLRENELGWITEGFDNLGITSLLSSILQNNHEYQAMAEHIKSNDIDNWDNLAERTLEFIESNL